jgi:hypothetical protein
MVTTKEYYEDRHCDVVEARTLGGVLQWSAISAERRKSERDFQAEKDGRSGSLDF